jgi:hypothetical protein
MSVFPAKIYHDAEGFRVVITDPTNVPRWILDAFSVENETIVIPIDFTNKNGKMVAFVATERKEAILGEFDTLMEVDNRLTNMQHVDEKLVFNVTVKN